MDNKSVNVKLMFMIIDAVGEISKEFIKGFVEGFDEEMEYLASAEGIQDED